MSKLQTFFTSTKTMSALLLVYALSMAIGTFVENDYGTPAAKVLIYNAKWFEALQLWLILLFIANIKRYQLLKKEKWPLLVFHLSFVLIFIGAGITRYISFEGSMPIPEGETSNEIITTDTFFKLRIADKQDVLQYDKAKYTMSSFDEANTNPILKQSFKGKYQFKNQIISLKSLDYFQHAKKEFIESPKGKKHLEIVSLGSKGRESFVLQEGDIKQIGQSVFSFNKAMPGAIQITDVGGKLLIQSPFQGNSVQMAGQQKGVVTDSAALAATAQKVYLDSLQPIRTKSLYTINSTQFVIPNLTKKGYHRYTKGDRNNEQDKEQPDVLHLELSTNNQSKQFYLTGGKGTTGFDKNIQLGNLTIDVGFGSKIIKTPFAIKLRDFQLERYPGSNAASSYASEITVIDKGKENNRRIYMNNIMDYSGYRFFQASYFPNEMGTILSVNKDWWGTNVTYLGYMLLFFGLTAALFWKGTRFWKLNQQLKNIAQNKTNIWLLLFLLPLATNAQHGTQLNLPEINVDSLIDSHQIPTEHLTKFNQLQIQDNQGRIKPVNTYALELLRKIHQSSSYKTNTSANQLSATEWFLGMHTDPSSFGRIPTIKVGIKGGDKLAEQANANGDDLTSVAKLIAIGNQNKVYFVLSEQYGKSFSKRAADQSNYDKEVIKLSERFEIAKGILEEQYLKLFPIKNDLNDTWSSTYYFVKNDSLASDFDIEINKDAISLWANYKKALIQSKQSNNWSGADAALQQIIDYQQQWGANVLLPPAKINWEIRYNQWNLFFVCMIAYSVLAFVLFVFAFLALFYPNKIIKTIINICLGALVIVLAAHLFGLGLRWYISGHAPWSNGYEAIVFISWTGVLSGVLLYRNRNAFIPTAGCIVAVIMMGFAHGGDLLDPQITPLVPVLKSYWLMIHVAIITSSYGFFGLGAILSIIALLLIIIRNQNNQITINNQLKEISIVAEMALTIGILNLTIGVFMGGMWANESWGRYWSWDPKETWAFISVIVYAFVLHMRLVPNLRGNLAFNMASMWAISTIIMTWIGVNYYLSGLHSYAAGDPIPIPAWIYYTAAFMLTISLVAYFKNRAYKRLQDN